MSQPDTPNRAPMPPQDDIRPPASQKPSILLSYATPPPGVSIRAYNRWWMILLRIAAGGAASVICLFIGGIAGDATGQHWLLFVPAGIVFIALTVLLIKYKRFGYLTGFIATPIVLFVAFIIFIIIVCAGYKP